MDKNATTLFYWVIKHDRGVSFIWATLELSVAQIRYIFRFEWLRYQSEEPIRILILHV